MIIAAGQWYLLDEWLRNNYPYLYGNDTGETEYWKNIDSAKYFIDERVLRGNVRLSPEQKEMCLEASEKAFDECKTWWPFDSGSEVVCYYNALAVALPPIVGSSDPNIGAILGLSTEGAVSATAADSTGAAQQGRPEGEKTWDFSKIPWWAWVLPLALIFGTRK
jgi:hypothetical protein